MAAVPIDCAIQPQLREAGRDQAKRNIHSPEARTSICLLLALIALTMAAT